MSVSNYSSLIVLIVHLFPFLRLFFVSLFFTLKIGTYVLFKEKGDGILEIQGLKKSCLDKVEKYKLENEEFLKNKVVQSFLQHKQNQILLINVICNPSKENEENLDKAFKKFYFNIRFISFISSALYFNAINFDKKYRKIQHRQTLTVDQPLNAEEGGTFKDLICDESADIKLDEILKSESITSYLENPLLCRAVETLTDKQKVILDLAYVKGLNDTEIGNVLKKSQQAVSKTHKKALKNIYKFLQESRGEEG